MYSDVRFGLSWTLRLSLAAATLSLAALAHAGVPYNIQVDVGYAGGISGIGGAASPDSGFVRFTNVGSSDFIGTLGVSGVSGFGPGGDVNAFDTNLLAGASKFFVAGPESSNQGGFNGPFNTPQNGLQISLNGVFQQGANSMGANLSMFDKDIHSGVFRTNPFGVTLDNYILQGGDPLGRDTGDGYEETQTGATFHFASGITAVPEPGLLPFSAVALGGLLTLGMRRRKRG